jgi:hypothetical protein
MKIYIASHDKDEALRIASILGGHEIVSRWIYGTFAKTETYSIEDRERIAQEDVDDVMSCDVLIHIAGNEKYSGGKFVETGIAIALGKTIFLLGRRENMLMYSKEIMPSNEFELPTLLESLELHPDKDFT